MEGWDGAAGSPQFTGLAPLQPSQKHQRNPRAVRGEGCLAAEGPGSGLQDTAPKPSPTLCRGRPLPLCPFSQLPAIPGASSAQKEPQEKKGEASELAPAQAARPPSGEEEQQGALKAPSSSETSLPQERTSAAVPLVLRRTGSLQSLPPKIKAGLPQRRGMSCPVLPTLTRAWGAQEKQSPT